MEIANVFEHVSKEKFRSAANKLLGECFLLKKHKDTASDYNYILNNKVLASSPSSTAVPIA